MTLGLSFHIIFGVGFKLKTKLKKGIDAFR